MNNEITNKKQEYYKLYKISIIIFAIMVLPISDILTGLTASSNISSAINLIFVYLRPVSSILLIVTSKLCMKYNLVTKKLIPVLTMVLGVLATIWFVLVLIFIMFVSDVFNYFTSLIF